jgi:hypothetical protein
MVTSKFPATRQIALIFLLDYGPTLYQSLGLSAGVSLMVAGGMHCLEGSPS